MKPWFVLLVCMVWLGHCDEPTETVTSSDSSTSTEGNTTAENPENENSLPSEPAEPVVKDNPDQGDNGETEESTTDSDNPDQEADEKTEDTNEGPEAETDEVSVDKATEEQGPSPTANNAEVDSTTASDDESTLDEDNNQPDETSPEKPNPDVAADVPSESDANSSDKREPAEPIRAEDNLDQGNNGNPEESTTHSNIPDSEVYVPVAENDEEPVDKATEDQGPSPPENNAEVDSPTATDDDSPLNGDNNQPEIPNPGLEDNVPSESDDNKPEGSVQWNGHETPASGDHPKTHNPFPPMPGKYKPPKPPGRAPPGPRNDGEESETKNENDHHIPNPRKQERPKGDDPRNTNSEVNQKEASRHFPPRRNCNNMEMTDGHSLTSDMEQSDTENDQTEPSRNNSKPVRCYPTPPQMEEKHCAILRKIKELKLDDHAGIKAASWMCFFKYVSNFNTWLTRSSRKGRDYGISQFNNHQHCKDGDLPSRNMCNTDCHKFLDHDLTDDFECLKTIVKNEASLTFWSAWNKHCKGKEHHHYVAGCHP